MSEWPGITNEIQGCKQIFDQKNVNKYINKNK